MLQTSGHSRILDLYAGILIKGLAATEASNNGVTGTSLVPRGFLAPIIIIFCVTGTYTASGNPWEVWIMVAFGIVGYFAQKYRFSPAGILLGVILGTIAEQGFRNTLVISDGNFIGSIAGRPISILIVVMIVAALYFALKPKKWEQVEEATDEALEQLQQAESDWRKVPPGRQVPVPAAAATFARR